ncbi:MAG: VapE domain-containing protein [Halioglobus sp.]
MTDNVHPIVGGAGSIPDKPNNQLKERDPSFPHVRLDKEGNVTSNRATIENLRELMSACMIHVSYNIITKRLDVWGVNHLPGEAANAASSILLSKANEYDLPDKVVSHYLARVAEENATNPVLGWLETLPADKIDCPVPEFINRCEFTHEKWATVAFTRWLIQAVAAADYATQTPNEDARPEFAYTLVVLGNQGTNKTSGMRKLLPKEMQIYFTSGKTLDTSNKDSYLAAISNWIVELGEIDATFRKSDIAALKSFLSNPSDEIRKPYARASTMMPRQTCYTATVNVPDFLKDATGNRRYWPIELEGSIPDMPEELVLRLWQWAWQSYLAGDQWWPTPEEETLHSNIIGKYEEKSMEDRIRDCYDFDHASRNVYVTPTEILREVGGNARENAQVGRLLNGVLGIEKPSKSSRTYAMPPRTEANLWNG